MDKNLEYIRHSTAHVLAQALDELYPGTLFATGPATEQGFFYDVLTQTPLKESDLPYIQERMHEIVRRNLPITHYLVPKADAQKLFAHNPFKMEIMQHIEDAEVGIAQQGDFKDLCRGGHVASTGDLPHFTLLGISGAYWRGDKNNAQLQRIFGTAFATAEELESFIQKRKDAAEYDHRKLGKDLELFMFSQEGTGFPFFLPKGTSVIRTLQNWMRRLLSPHNYKEIITPTILHAHLWQRSGHYEHYRDNMYFTTIDDQPHAVKPMNCPGAFIMYGQRPRSYRELPLKLFEFGHVHRHELSGVLHGLLRVRAFTQDDTHIFCAHESLEQEISQILKIAFTILETLKFSDIYLALSTRPEKALGDEDTWNKATDALKRALESTGKPYVINEGEGAFYGPKIEIGIRDSMDRTWQCGTVQVDFFQPENFDLTYTAPDGTQQRPVIIHQALYGSMERFFAILLEHFKGELPLWLQPIQARVLPIKEEHRAYADEINDLLLNAGIRSEVDMTPHALSTKIKHNQLEKIPYMIVVGGKEAAERTVTIRSRSGEQLPGVALDALVNFFKEHGVDLPHVE